MEQRRSAGDAVDAPDTARVVLDERGVVTYWSESATRLLGYPAGDVLGLPAVRFLDGEITGELAESLSAGREVSRWHGTVPLRHRDGRRLSVRLLAHHREDGGRTDWLLVSPPVGQRPRKDEIEALERWSFAQSPSCAIAVFDTALRLQRMNAFMARLMALTEADARGFRMTEMMVGSGSQENERLMARALQTGEPQFTEGLVRTMGEPTDRIWSRWLSPLRHDDGRIVGVLLSAHDTTEQRMARRRLQVLNEASTRIGGTLDMSRTAQELSDVTVPELADLVTVDLLTSAERGREPAPGPLGRSVPIRRLAHTSVHEGVPEAVVAAGERHSFPAGSAPADSLFRTESVISPVGPDDEWLKDDPARAASTARFGMHSLMAVPMVARGRTLGVVNFIRHRRPDPFSPDDILLGEELTARAALAIDNARRYTRERETATMLQRSLLPRQLPEQAAVEVASRYLPAGIQAGVGGDWFDVIPLSGARVALVVGDVVGHGIHASATMGRLRTAVRTLADVDLPPDELLTHLDDLVAGLVAESGALDAGSAELGATCLYAVYDPVSRRCTLARAGHLEPVMVRPSPDGGDPLVGMVRLPAGPPLGLGGLPFETAEIELPEGSLLAFYTDGLIEARDHDLDEGIRQLCQALAQPSGSLEDVCETVLSRLPPSRSRDDIALLVARTRALDAGQVATWDVPPEPAAVAQARRNAVAQLAEWDVDDSAFIIELVVSELVTNAIRHAEPPIRLRLIRYSGNTLICEVSDGSSSAPHLRRARVFEESGRGLLLVAQLTERWGTRHTTTGKTIWAERSLAGAGGSAGAAP